LIIVFETVVFLCCCPVSQWQIICKVTSNTLVAETQGYAGNQLGNYTAIPATITNA
jgi:hypothetical protein